MTDIELHNVILELKAHIDERFDDVVKRLDSLEQTVESWRAELLRRGIDPLDGIRASRPPPRHDTDPCPPPNGSDK